MDINLTLLSSFLPLVLAAYLHLSRDLIHENPVMVTGCCATALAHLGLVLWDHLIYPDLSPIALPVFIVTSYTLLLAALTLRLIRKRARSFEAV